MEDNVRKRMCVCEIYICIWLGHFAVQQKLTEYCKSTLIKIFSCKGPPKSPYSVVMAMCTLLFLFPLLRCRVVGQANRMDLGSTRLSQSYLHLVIIFLVWLKSWENALSCTCESVTEWWMASVQGLPEYFIKKKNWLRIWKLSWEHCGMGMGITSHKCVPLATCWQRRLPWIPHFSSLQSLPAQHRVNLEINSHNQKLLNWIKSVTRSDVYS